MLRKSLQRIENKAFHIVCGLLGVWLLVWASLCTFPITPESVHCPKAIVVDRDCLIHFNNTGSELVPHTGDKGFVHCQCAEKTASELRGSMASMMAIDLPVAATEVLLKGHWTLILQVDPLIGEIEWLGVSVDHPPESFTETLS